jgi:hypothetical protein
MCVAQRRAHAREQRGIADALANDELLKGSRFAFVAHCDLLEPEVPVWA